MKVLITERTVKLRLRRALQAQGKHLRITINRRRREFGPGRYHVADANGVIDQDVNLEELARNLGNAIVGDAKAQTLRAAWANEER